MFDIEIEPDEGISRTDVLGSGDGSQRTFSAVLSHVPIVPGSFSSVLGNFHGEDNTSGSITGLGIIGSINYTSGAVSITHEATPPSAGAVISATYRSWIPDSREAKDVGNVPTTFHMRNYDELAIVLVQISEDRSNWMTLFSGMIDAWDIMPLDRSSVRFVRAMSTKRCRIFGASTNLQ